MITYKTATAQDIEQLVSSRLEALRAVNGLPDSYKFREEFIAHTREYFSGRGQTTILALSDGKVIGCASICYIHLMPTCSHPTGNRAHLMNVYTNKEYQRQGIARELVGKLIKEAKEKGVTEISLDTTEEGRGLYRNLGFAESKECMVLLL